MFKQKRSKQGGFTLLELLVVVALLAILAIVAIPNVLRFLGESDRTAALEEQHNVLVAISAALHQSPDVPRTVFMEYTDQNIPSDPNSPNNNDVAKWLDKTTRFDWNISITGVLSPGADNPLAP